MNGLYKNLRRVDYSPGIKKPNVAVDGIGKYKHITHVDAKNAVGSAILEATDQDPSLTKHGRNIGRRSLWQKKFWANREKTSKLPNIKLDADLPQHSDNSLTLVDCFDVPIAEKPIVEQVITSSTRNDPNIVFLNNVTNIKFKFY